MIDPLTISILSVIADVYVATGRVLPPWVVDALTIGASDPAMDSTVARKAELVLRDAQSVEAM